MAATGILSVAAGNRIDYTPGSAVTAGDLVILEDLVGLATEDIAASVLGSLAVEGVFRFPKNGTAIAQGKYVYWHGADANAGPESSTGTGDALLGKAAKAAAAGDSTVDVKLTP